MMRSRRVLRGRLVVSVGSRVFVRGIAMQMAGRHLVMRRHGTCEEYVVKARRRAIAAGKRRSGREHAE